MEIRVERKYYKQKYTIGRVYIDGEFLCNSLEDTDRNLFQSMSKATILSRKVYGCTAIPKGRYEVTIATYSSAFGKREYYKNFCDGYLPRLIGVKGFDGILMHRGVDETHTEGCILLGFNTEVGKLTDSKKAFEMVYNRIKKASDKGEKIWITID